MFLDDKAARGSAKSPVTSICIIEDSHQDPPALRSAGELADRKIYFMLQLSPQVLEIKRIIAKEAEQTVGIEAGQ